ncbi:hypothetical protein N0V90_004114 [Kalmusia sp. IMI 367209]|nr:hypothetical protein N0V90_004114 [Kalmusia sp. IMI 367209]
MHLRIYLASILTIAPLIASLERRSPSAIAVTDYVLPLVGVPQPHPITPSSKHLHKRRSLNGPKPNLDIPNEDEGYAPDAIATVQQDVLTLGGRVYMTNITLANTSYTFIVDTGSSDTWIASSTFRCTSRLQQFPLPQRACGFGNLFNALASPTYGKFGGSVFGVQYTDGEYLVGEMGEDELIVGNGGIGAKARSEGLKFRQTIGVVKRGWWMGDGRSSGLMGLAYPTLASNVKALNYTSIVFSIFAEHSIPQIFSLALSRPTGGATNGGLLAIGGIPDIPHDLPFVSVPIHPLISDTYAFYSIAVDGFEVVPPTSYQHSISSPFREARPYKGTTRQAAPSDFKMILDSGTTLLYLPDTTADLIANMFVPPARYSSASNTYITDCDADMPRFGVVVGGTTFWVNAEDMMNPTTVTRNGTHVRRGDCTLAVQRQEDRDAVLGDTFLKNVVVVFDIGTSEVRLAGREKY